MNQSEMNVFESALFKFSRYSKQWELFLISLTANTVLLQNLVEEIKKSGSKQEQESTELGALQELLNMQQELQDIFLRAIDKTEVVSNIGAQL